MKLLISSIDFSAVNCVGKCTITKEDKAHPNKLPFTGTLLLVDQASDRPPHGAEGHRIYVPKSVAKKRLGTLVNTALNYEVESLSGHATRHKVGVITGAWLDGDEVKVRGFIWSKDFPEAVKDLHSSRLGMSMELADVYVRSKDDLVWYLEDFHFSGATALYKNAAAYGKTALAASAANGNKSSGGTMPKTEQERKAAKAAEQDQGKLLTTAIAASVDSAVQTGFKSLIPDFAKQIGESVKTAVVEAIRPLHESFEDLKVVQIAAAGADLEARKTQDEENDDQDDTEDSSDDDDMKAKKDDEDEEMAAKSDDEDDLEAKKDDEDDLEAELETLEDDSAEEEPGEVNKDSSNKGNKTTVTKGKSKSKSMPVAAGSVKASAIMINKLYASTKQLLEARKGDRKTIKKLNNKIAAMEAQLERAAEQTDRRTVVPAELSTILAKSNVDIRELQASGQKLSVADVDQMLSQDKLGHALDVTTRMHIKNMFLERGLMEQGEVRRFQ